MSRTPRLRALSNPSAERERPGGGAARVPTRRLSHTLCVCVCPHELNHSVIHNYPAPAPVGGLSAVLPSGVAGEAGIAASAAA